MTEVVLDRFHFIEDSDDEVFVTRLLLETQRIAIELIHHNDMKAFDNYRTTLDNFLPALVLVDLNMPKMRGNEVIAQERARNPSIHLVMGICTGSEDPADKKISLESGADFFVQKPFDLSALKKLSQELEVLDLIEDDAGFTRVVFTQADCADN